MDAEMKINLKEAEKDMAAILPEFERYAVGRMLERFVTWLENNGFEIRRKENGRITE